MTRRIRAAVLGLGVGERHVARYQQIPGCEVAAVCDLDPTRLTDVAARYGIPARHTDYRRITESPDIDVVSVCTYDDVHVEHAESALAHGKHVMVEKPVALSRPDAERLLAAQQASGCLLTSNLILRASPRFRWLRQAIEAGELGEIFYMEGDYLHPILHKIASGWRGRMPGYSVIYGGGIHLIDLMRWLVGDEVETVCGMGNKLLTAGSGYPSHDTTVNILRFRRGALAKTVTTFGPQRTKFHVLNVYGTSATFLNDVPDARVFVGTEPPDERRIDVPYLSMEKGDLLPEFVAAVRDGSQPPVNVADVFRVMDVCFAAEESIKSGRTIDVTYLI